MFYLNLILAIAISYLVGSMPTAYIFGRLLKGIDIRNFGSGNVGATNALRVLGKGAGITVLFIDLLKGLLPVVFIGDYILFKGTELPSDVLRIVLGFCSILGHNWTVFLNFKGGKGVATTFGVLIGLALKIYGFNIILGLIILVWFLSFFVTRIVSISSVLAGITFPILMVLFKHSKGFSNGLIFFSFLAAIFIILRHLPNLKRVVQGKEPRLTLKKS